MMMVVVVVVVFVQARRFFSWGNVQIFKSGWAIAFLARGFLLGGSLLGGWVVD
jgi:hypothetical protein